MSAFDLQAALVDLEGRDLYRRRHVLESAQGPVIKIDGCAYLNFCSNDYLGLANHPSVVKAFQDAANSYGVGGGSSHLIVGHNHPHHALEEALAEFTGRPRAVLFSSGYMANLGVINALLGRQDGVFEDRLNHASLLDAGQLSGARFQRYLHCDVDNLEKRLDRSKARRKLVVTDGVFSMDGNIAPLSDLVVATRKRDSWLMVDDAHGFGVLGATGAGCVEQNQLSPDEVPVLVGTLGKALGTMGAFVVGSEALAEMLIQFARTYIFTTALPPAVAAATLVSLKLVQTESWRREKLQALIKLFKDGCHSLGIDLMPSDTAIQPIVIGEAKAAMAVARRMQSKGVLVSAIRPPSVPEGSSRLRITISAEHTEQQVKQLLNVMEYACIERKDVSTKVWSSEVKGINNG